MSKLLSSALPPVSREFALELQRTFRPMPVVPGFDRDKMMQSAGEQRVVDYILRKSIQKTLPSNATPEEQSEAEVEEIKKPKKNLWSLFSNRVS